MLTARLPPASESRAEAHPPPRERRTAAAPGAGGPRPAASRVVAGGPDFTRIAGQAVKGVANISSLQVVRTPNSPFGGRPVLPLLLRRGRRRLRLARSPVAQPRLGRRHLLGRLRRDEQPRRRREHARNHRRAARQTRGARTAHRHRPGHRHRAAQAQRQRASPVVPVGRFEPAANRRVGARDWQPVPVERDGHRRHRQRHGTHERRVRRLRGLHSDRRGDQPGQLRAARSSTPAASWSASTPASSARAAAIRASASRSRAISPGTSSTTCSSTAKCAAGRLISGSRA